MEEQIPNTQPVTNDKKRSKTVITITIIVVMVLAILSVGSYLINRYVIKKVAEKTTESIIEEATGDKVDIDSDSDDISVQSDDGSYSITSDNKWPNDIPSSVPEFTYGEIEISSTISSYDNKSGWNLVFKDLKSDAFDNYISELKAAGWSETGTITTGDDKISNMENDSYQLIFSYNSKENTGSLVITSK